MDCLQHLLNRYSIPLLEGEIPAAQLTQILQSALSAPDHKHLKPWRFIEVSPKEKTLLAQLALSVKQAQGEPVDETSLPTLLKQFSRAPHIIIGVFSPKECMSIPPSEQLLSMGAAMQSIMLSTHLAGYGAFWRTGALAYLPAFHKALKLASHEQIAGFLYLGRHSTASSVRTPPKRPELAEHFTRLSDLVAPQ